MESSLRYELSAADAGGKKQGRELAGGERDAFVIHRDLKFLHLNDLMRKYFTFFKENPPNSQNAFTGNMEFLLAE